MAIVSGNGSLGSLDVEGIVAQLMSIERRPLTQLNQREDAFKAKLSAWGTLKSAIATFQGAADKLARPATFSVYSASLSEASVAAVTTTASAIASTYSLEVAQLAASQKLASAAYASSTASVGSGTLTVEFGRYDASANTFTANADKPSFTVTLAPGADSLEAVRNAINAANKGVSATIVNDGTGARLVLTSTATGEVNGLRITAADDDGNSGDASGLSALAFDPVASAGNGKNLQQLVAAADARLSVDGLAITSASNQVTNVIEGVTLSLAKVTTAPVTLSIGRDYAKLTETVDAFVKAYNDLAKQIKDLTFYDQATKAAGKLQGETAVASIQNRIRTALNGQSATADAALARLADLGVTFGADGTLSLDGAKLETALKTDPGAVVSLMCGTVANPSSTAMSGSGIAGSLCTMLDQMLGADGLVSGRTAAIGENIKRIDGEQERMTHRLELIERRYRTQFAGLDKMLAGMSATLNFVNRY